MSSQSVRPSSMASRQPPFSGTYTLSAPAERRADTWMSASANGSSLADVNTPTRGRSRPEVARAASTTARYTACEWLSDRKRTDRRSLGRSATGGV
ncbi:MAG: hypothetical protein ACOVO0_01045, partial [Burkholderiaceae bacterium]